MSKDSEYEGRATVKRIHSACCGMRNGGVYLARVDFGYVSVRVKNRWTSAHYAAFDGENPYFALVNKLEVTG